MTEYERKLNEFYTYFGTHKTMVLSTSANDNVSSRMMSTVIINGKIYFQTDKTFEKYNQIIANQNVSFCVDNIQIKGICTEIGKPKTNKTFIEIYKKSYPNSYKMYSNLENEVLFETKPTYIKRWIYENNIPYIEILDLKNKEYIKIKYNLE